MKDASDAAAAAAPAADADVSMADAEDKKEAEEEKEVEMVDPTESLNKEHIETLTSAMGFTLLRAQKGLLNGNGGTVEGAVEWLDQHSEDADIDEPIALVPKNAGVAQSYKCNDCGKGKFSNAGGVACKPCPAGFVQPTDSRPSTACTACTAASCAAAPAWPTATSPGQPSSRSAAAACPGRGSHA